VFRRHIISRAPHKMVTSLLPFLPKTSEASYTNLTTFDSVKMEG
jgi:hypothetical protein